MRNRGSRGGLRRAQDLRRSSPWIGAPLGEESTATVADWKDRLARRHEQDPAAAQLYPRRARGRPRDSWPRPRRASVRSPRRRRRSRVPARRRQRGGRGRGLCSARRPPAGDRARWRLGLRLDRALDSARRRRAGLFPGVSGRFARRSMELRPPERGRAGSGGSSARTASTSSRRRRRSSTRANRTIREYAAELLEASGEGDVLRPDCSTRRSRTCGPRSRASSTLGHPRPAERGSPHAEGAACSRARPRRDLPLQLAAASSGTPRASHAPRCGRDRDRPVGLRTRRTRGRRACSTSRRHRALCAARRPMPTSSWRSSTPAPTTALTVNLHTSRTGRGALGRLDEGRASLREPGASAPTTRREPRN